jgi:cell division protein FtsB
MTEPSVFKDLDPAQLYYLKAQYLASQQVLDQSEKALKDQLEALTKARAQLGALMRALDHHIDPPAHHATRKPTARSRTRTARGSRGGGPSG